MTGEICSLSSYPYDQSAAIRPQMTTPVRSKSQNPCDLNSAIFTTRKKFVTAGRRGVVRGCDLHPDGQRVCVSGGDHGLENACGAFLEALQHIAAHSAWKPCAGLDRPPACCAPPRLRAAKPSETLAPGAESTYNIHFSFTPTSASWLNMVERFFRDVSENWIKRGVFHSVTELEKAIVAYLDIHNKNPKPFIWTAKASGYPSKSRQRPQVAE